MTGYALEDFYVGLSYTQGEYLITEEEIIEFASKYDPQPMHLDIEFAKNSYFGGLIASGWMSCAIFMRLQCDTPMIKESTCLASPGIDNIRWRQPVRPGDRLTMKYIVDQIITRKSKPNSGVVCAQVSLINQHNEEVMTLRSKGVYLKKNKSS